MFELGLIVASTQGRPCKWVEKLKEYHEIKGEAREHFTCDNPCSYERFDDRVLTCDIKELVFADFDKAVSKAGNLRKIPIEYLKEVRSEVEAETQV